MSRWPWMGGGRISRLRPLAAAVVSRGHRWTATAHRAAEYRLRAGAIQRDGWICCAPGLWGGLLVMRWCGCLGLCPVEARDEDEDEDDERCCCPGLGVPSLPCHAGETRGRSARRTGLESGGTQPSSPQTTPIPAANAKWKMDHGRVAACSGNAPPTQHSKPGRGGWVVVCRARPRRYRFVHSMTRDGGGTLAGARLAEREGEKNNPVSGDGPLRGGTGTGNGGEHTRRWALARSLDKRASVVGPPLLHPPQDPPQAMSARIPAKQMPPQARGNRRAHKKGPTPPDDMALMAQNQVDEPHLFAPLSFLIYIRGRLLTSQKCQQKRLNAYLSIFFSCSVETIPASLAVVSEPALGHDGHGQHSDLMGPKWNHGLPYSAVDIASKTPG